MAAVALLLLRGEHPRNDEVETGLLPGAVSARQRLDVGVAELLQRTRGEQGADAAGAVERDRRVVLRDGVLDAGLDEPLAEVHRTGDVSLVVLVALANVDERA